MKIKCLIIDDEPVARQGLAAYVEKVEFLDLCGICKNAIEANALLRDCQPELLFLDIKMPEINGIEWLRSLLVQPIVILTTAYREFALDGFDMNVLDYLLKPIAFDRFLKSCNRAYQLFIAREKNDPAHSIVKDAYDDFFFIKSTTGYLRIAFADILYIEALKDFVSIHTPGKRHLVLISMKHAEELLPPRKFIRTHRSFIVSVNKVDGVEGNALKVNGISIPVSKQFQKEVFERLLDRKVWKRNKDS